MDRLTASIIAAGAVATALIVTQHQGLQAQSANGDTAVWGDESATLVWHANGNVIRVCTRPSGGGIGGKIGCTGWK